MCEINDDPVLGDGNVYVQGIDGDEEEDKFETCHCGANGDLFSCGGHIRQLLHFLSCYSDERGTVVPVNCLS